MSIQHIIPVNKIHFVISLKKTGAKIRRFFKLVIIS